MLLPGGRLKLLAGLCGVLFLVGEFEHLYSQPQEGQSQIQPMFISIAGLIIVVDYLQRKLARRTFRLVAGAFFVAFVAVGMWNVKFMSAERGDDSRSVAAVRQLAQIFPLNGYRLVSQGFEAWRTWWYVEVYRGRWDDFVSNDQGLVTPFIDSPGISGSDAAAVVKRHIGEAFAAGRRVVACSLWVQDKAQFVGSLNTLAERARAEAYDDALRNAFPLGRNWDTPVGRFVELLPAGDPAQGDAGGREK